MSMFVRARNLPGDGRKGSNTHQLAVFQIRRVALTPEVQYKTEYSTVIRKRKMKLHMNRYYSTRYFKLYFAVCACVCVFSSHSFWTSMDVPAGVTQEEGNTGFSIHLLSAVLALIFLARRIQPFLSLVDREVEFVYERFNRSPPVGHFYFHFLVFQ